MKPSRFDQVIIKLSERFRILETIGEGSFSTVFKAEDRKTNNLCTLKIFHKKQSIEIRRYFDQLNKIQKGFSKIDTKYLELPYDSGNIEGTFYQVFKYIDPPICTFCNASNKREN